MKIVILLAVFGYAVGNPLLGQEECVWGPSYWCSHISHARQCGAVKHCMDTVWKHQILPKPETEDKDKTSVKACTYCELLVNEVKDVLHEKSTETEIASLLSNVCTYLPSSDDIDLCKGIVTEYAPEIINIINNDISTDMICTVVGFCPGLEDGKTPNPEPVKLYTPEGTRAVSSHVGKNTTYCQDCQRFFHDVQESITSKETERELEELLNQTICSQLGPLSSVCTDLLQQYLPMGLQILASQIDPDITCRIFGFCSTSGQHVPVIHIKNVFMGRGPLKSEECDICKDFVTEIDNAIKDSTTQAKVKEVLENQVCPDLGSLQDSCKQLVEEYLPVVFELLINELDPKTLCEAIGLCTTPQLAPVVEAALVEPARMVGPGMVKEGVECYICKLVIQEADTLLKQNKTKEEIKSLVLEVCKKLPSEDLQSQCSSFVTEYINLVLDELVEELDPVAICQKLKMCSTPVFDADVKAKPVGAEDVCDICVSLVQYLELLLANVSQEQILAGLEQVCSYVPAQYTAECQTDVKKYGPLIISALKSGMAPRTVCTLAQVCTSGAPMMTIPIPEAPVKVEAGPTLKCKLCGTVLILVKTLLNNSATKEEIKTGIEALCKVLPTEFAAACQSIVDTYLDQVIELLEKDIDVNEICEKIGFCAALSSPSDGTDLFISPLMKPIDTLPLILPSVWKDTEKKVQANDIECTACQDVMKYLDKTLQANKTEENIKEALKEVCSKMPAAISGECSSLVDQYTKLIIDYIVFSESPDAICKDLGLCAQARVASMKQLPKPVHVQLVKDTQEHPVKASAECVLCEFALKEIDSILKGNTSEAAITDALEKVCSILPDTIATECSSFVKQYAKQIIALLVDGINPEEICTKIGLCSAQEKQPIVKNSVSAGAVCMGCEFVMRKLDSMLKGNTSEAAIEQALAKVCSDLPDAISGECVDFVKQYGKMVVQFLVLELDPEVVCTKLGLCEADLIGSFAAKVHIIKDTPKVNNEGLCEVCKLFVGQLKEYIKNNHTEAEVEKYAEELCNILPDTVTAQCHDVVKEYVPAILVLLEENLNASQVCQKIALCPKVQTSVPSKDSSTLYFHPRKALLGANECTWGPSYWCASKENANKCGAVEHCMKHVWN